MAELPLPNARFLESTRGRIVAELRRGQRTVEELAAMLGMTDNGVRSHLSSLERDRLIQQAGVRRVAGAGKPAILYELHPQTQLLLSRAYAPVLQAVVETLVSKLPVEEVHAVLNEVGERLAAGAGRASGSTEARMQTAAAVLTGLGGDVEVEQQAGSEGFCVRGSGCPLSAVVSARPELCLAVESMLAHVTGIPVKSHCQHGANPRCCFATS